MYELEFSQTTNHGLWLLPIKQPSKIPANSSTSHVTFSNHQFLRYSDWKKFSLVGLMNLVNSYTDDPYYLPSENDKSYDIYIRTICNTFDYPNIQIQVYIDYDSETNIATYRSKDNKLIYVYDYNQDKIVNVSYSGDYDLNGVSTHIDNFLNDYFPVNLKYNGNSGFDMSIIGALSDIKDSLKNYDDRGNKIAVFGELFSYDGINLSGPDNSFYTTRNTPERTIDFQGIKITPKNVFGSDILHVVDGSYNDETIWIKYPDVTYIHKIKGYDLADFIFEGENRVTAASPKLYNSHFEYFRSKPGEYSNKYFSFIWEIVISHN